MIDEIYTHSLSKLLTGFFRLLFRLSGSDPVDGFVCRWEVTKR
ncbi:hypothetical protein SAMN05216452_3655 [Nitratireductor aquibiodomus]|uniref:Uncharacterized protein n=1 Tax=Nitratireductor aquibiodomus TaxID=204799 RepID=A0A1H4N7A7_9HYPH|nr:hypothetical protein SAMN05216452_3655 [Nitratireductor aquibiodomus]